MARTTQEIQLVSRPHGTPTPENFGTVTTELPDPGPGQVLVRNTVLSVDPYMRGRMNDTKSYVPPFPLGETLDGGAIGVVEASGADSVPVGATVQHMAGWREAALLPADQVRVVDTSRVPDSAYLGVLGMPGLTAYVGLTRIAQLAEGETVFVSGAAGAVGSAAGQMAHLLGAGKVVGSAGSADKVSWLVDDLGFDAALNYRDGSVRKQLEPHAPVDVYFDNVGGEHLEAALFHMADFGRIAACGAISDYNATQAPAGPRFLTNVVTRRLTLRGFIVSEHGDLAGEFYRQAGAWVAEGKLQARETVVEGLDHMVEAFLSLFEGANTGKMLVRP
ncbi:NADP-dependent oxidoreductase [Nocardioides nanhaiensis]|uniref:NADP-dependent oxidoreductase n=1 Tax=Nocardioides nanhaiensis TaxID=1476871 RepID=A0ABP8WQI7_9ACTN